MTPVEMFFICLILGLLLLCAEIFVPGGILGAFGALALVGAIIFGFVAFKEYGYLIALGIVLGTGGVIAAWVKYFPKSRLGRSMIVTEDIGGDVEATEPGLDELAGKEGEALSDLRPGGFARLDGRRVDVVTQGGMISKGARVRVVEVEGNRVVVAEVTP